MAYTKEQLLAAALELEPSEREALAEQLMLSLPPIDPEIEKALIKEAARRQAKYEAGETSAIPVEEVLARLSHKGKSKT